MIQAHARPPRIGLIGVSGYAEIYLDYLLDEGKQDSFELTAAVVIPDHQDLPVVRVLRDKGVQIYNTYQEMFEKERGELELCFLPTGIQWHARMAVEAMEAGANVLVEKPLAGSVADAETIMQCEERTGKWVAVGFQDIYTEEIGWLKEKLGDGAIGKIKSIRMIGIWPRSRAYYRRNHWAGRLHMDGAAAKDSPLNNAFAHFVNLSLFLAGKTRLSSARVRVSGCELFRAHKIESFDTAVVKAESDDGIEFWFGVSHAASGYREPEIHIRGEKGTAIWHHLRHCMVMPVGSAPMEVPMPEIEVARKRMFQAVIAKSNNREVSVCCTRIAIEHTHLIEGIHQSCAINSIPPEFIEEVPVEGHANPVPAIRGIENLLGKALESGLFLRDEGFYFSGMQSSN